MPRPLPCTVDVLAGLTITRFQNGQLTVCHLDWQRDLDREFDADFAARALDQLLDVKSLVESRGYPCTPVNDWCLRRYADTIITNAAEAKRCNVFNSGGKRPVGLRFAREGDLVRSEVNGSGAHLGIGLLKHSVQNNVNDVAHGITSRETHDRLRMRLREQLPGIPEIEPDPVQPDLLASGEPDDDDSD